MHRLIEWVRQRAENLVALFLGVMFLAFIAQIIFRYVFNWPVGWSSELTVICWLYMVLLGSGLWLRESEEIRFDLVTDRLGPHAKRWVAVALGLVVVVVFGLSLVPTVKYIAFMKVESSSYLKIRMDVLYSVYGVFVLAVIVRYAWSVWRALRGEVATEADIAEKGYGL